MIVTRRNLSLTTLIRQQEDHNKLLLLFVNRAKYLQTNTGINHLNILIFFLEHKQEKRFNSNYLNFP